MTIIIPEDLARAAVSAVNDIPGIPIAPNAEDRAQVIADVAVASGIPLDELRRLIALAPVDVPPLENGSTDPLTYLRTLSAASGFAREGR